MQLQEQVVHTNVLAGNFTQYPTSIRLLNLILSHLRTAPKSSVIITTLQYMVTHLDASYPANPPRNLETFLAHHLSPDNSPEIDLVNAINCGNPGGHEVPSYGVVQRDRQADQAAINLRFMVINISLELVKAVDVLEAQITKKDGDENTLQLARVRSNQLQQVLTITFLHEMTHWLSGLILGSNITPVLFAVTSWHGAQGPPSDGEAGWWMEQVVFGGGVFLEWPETMKFGEWWDMSKAELRLKMITRESSYLLESEDSIEFLKTLPTAQLWRFRRDSSKHIEERKSPATYASRTTQGSLSPSDSIKDFNSPHMPPYHPEPQTSSPVGLGISSHDGYVQYYGRCGTHNRGTSI